MPIFQMEIKISFFSYGFYFKKCLTTNYKSKQAQLEKLL